MHFKVELEVFLLKSCLVLDQAFLIAVALYSGSFLPDNLLLSFSMSNMPYSI